MPSVPSEGLRRALQLYEDGHSRSEAAQLLRLYCPELKTRRCSDHLTRVYGPAWVKGSSRSSPFSDLFHLTSAPPERLTAEEQRAELRAVSAADRAVAGSVASRLAAGGARGRCSVGLSVSTGSRERRPAPPGPSPHRVEPKPRGVLRRTLAGEKRVTFAAGQACPTLRSGKTLRGLENPYRRELWWSERELSERESCGSDAPAVEPMAQNLPTPDVKTVVDDLVTARDSSKAPKTQPRAEDAAAVEDEFGDVLFAMVNTGRFLKVDSEQALSASAGKFERRFRALEEKVAASGHELADLSLEALDAIWDEVKQGE